MVRNDITVFCLLSWNRDQKLERPVPGSGEGGEGEEAGGRTQGWQHQRPISFTLRFY